MARATDRDVERAGAALYARMAASRFTQFEAREKPRLIDEEVHRWKRRPQGVVTVTRTVG